MLPLCSSTRSRTCRPLFHSERQKKVFPFPVASGQLRDYDPVPALRSHHGGPGCAQSGRFERWGCYHRWYSEAREQVGAGHLLKLRRRRTVASLGGQAGRPQNCNHEANIILVKSKICGMRVPSAVDITFDTPVLILNQGDRLERFRSVAVQTVRNAIIL